jgi:hypothetical protein
MFLYKNLCLVQQRFLYKNDSACIENEHSLYHKRNIKHLYFYTFLPANQQVIKMAYCRK